MRLARDSYFQVAAIITTTGYTTGYDAVPDAWDAWPAAAKMLLLFLMVGGACAGSTSGGMKLVRYLVAWKGCASRELRRFAEPNRITPVRLDGRTVSDHTVSMCGVFIAIYAATWMLGAFLLTFLGHDFSVAISASLSADI